MRDQFWGLGARTPNRKNIRKGDQVVFYVARPESAFVGTARLASDCFELSAEEQSKLSHDSTFFTRVRRSVGCQRSLGKVARDGVLGLKSQVREKPALGWTHLQAASAKPKRSTKWRSQWV